MGAVAGRAWRVAGGLPHGLRGSTAASWPRNEGATISPAVAVVSASASAAAVSATPPPGAACPNHAQTMPKPCPNHAHSMGNAFQPSAGAGLAGYARGFPQTSPQVLGITQWHCPGVPPGRSPGAPAEDGSRGRNLTSNTAFVLMYKARVAIKVIAIGRR